MSAPSPPLLAALSESQAMGLEIARRAGVEVLPIEERAFEEGEFKLRPLESVRDRTVFVVQSLAGSADAPMPQRLLRLLFLLMGLRDAGATRLIALVPYLPFARKDRRTQLRDPVTSRYVAQLLEAAGIARLVCVDVHNPAAFDNAFRIPVDHLSAIPMFVRHVADHLPADDIAVASPDVGGVKRAQIFRELLEAQLHHPVELVFVEKRRTQGVVSGGGVVGAVQGKCVIVLDDLCASGGTLVRASQSLREAGAASVHVAFAHAPQPRGLEALGGCPAISSVLVTDSVGPALVLPRESGASRFTLLHIAPLLSEAVARMVSGAPLSPLLQRWPPVGHLR